MREAGASARVCMCVCTCVRAGVRVRVRVRACVRVRVFVRTHAYVHSSARAHAGGRAGVGSSRRGAGSQTLRARVRAFKLSVIRDARSPRPALYPSSLPVSRPVAIFSTLFLSIFSFHSPPSISANFPPLPPLPPSPFLPLRSPPRPALSLPTAPHRLLSTGDRRCARTHTHARTHMHTRV